jgi:hypothetical protein
MTNGSGRFRDGIEERGMGQGWDVCVCVFAGSGLLFFCVGETEFWVGISLFPSFFLVLALTSCLLVSLLSSSLSCFALPCVAFSIPGWPASERVHFSCSLRLFGLRAV